MSDDQRDQLHWAENRDRRLPSFHEVLSRKTRPPVDLYMFYLFLQREGSEDILDFWLDVQQHENLCMAYFKDVRKSGRTIREDWPQYWEYAKRRGSIYGTMVGLPVGSTNKRSTSSTHDLSSENERKDFAVTGGATDEKGRLSTSPRPTSPPDADAAGKVEAGKTDGGRSPSSEKAHRMSTPFSFSKKRASRAPTVYPRAEALTRTHLIASAEHIYYRYLAPNNNAISNSESHEIYLPPALRIHSFPLSSTQAPTTQNELNMLAQIPDIFHQQKMYVYNAMEQDAFPRFLRSKAFGNLTPVSALVRLILGLLVLWIGLAVGFSLIFLDVMPKSKRFFLFIPFTIAILLLISHLYELDPVLVFLNRSESTPFRTLKIKEPYVKGLLRGRAVWITLLVCGFTAALTLLFWAVPGHRL